jgi:hypothetical protein
MRIKPARYDACLPRRKLDKSIGSKTLKDVRIGGVTARVLVVHVPGAVKPESGDTSWGAVIREQKGH